MNKERLRGFKRQAQNFVARHRKSKIIRGFAGFCGKVTGLYENSNYDPYFNGEYNILLKLAKADFKIIFDVGANVGDWALMARQVFPEAEIHCFEVVPQTSQTLKQQTFNFSNIIVNEFGLSDYDGDLEINYFPDNNALSTTLDYPHPYKSIAVKGRVSTGESYLRKLQINQIDFLKIDVEGNEAGVLKGFDEIITSGRASVVQVEYGLANILSRFLLRDIYKFFTERGYEVGKIYPTYVDFRDYQLADENFIGPNYLAVSRKREDLIKLLS